MTATADLSTTYGTVFIGLVVSAVLYGVTILQTYLYFRSYLHDSFSIKAMVAFLFTLDSVHIALCTYSIYWYLVINYGDTSVLDKILWSISIQTIFNGTIADIVQLFFARRVFALSKNWLLTGVIVAVSLVHLAVVIQFPIKTIQIGVFSKFKAEQAPACVAFAASAVADAVIAVSMCYYLSKSRTQIPKTNSVITTLIIYSVNTGLLTSLISMACLISFAVAPTNFVWLAFFWILGKCYINSLLGMLNSRSHLREGSGCDNPTFVELGNLPGILEESQESRNSGAHRRTIIRKPSTNAGALAVSVETSTQSKIDDMKPGDFDHRLTEVPSH